MYDSYWAVPEEDSDIVHYGVKGMKWGVRKSEYESMSRKDRRKLRKRKNKDYDDEKRLMDKYTLGGGSVRRINKRMNKGATYKQAKRREYARRFATTLALYGAARFVQQNPEKVLMGISKVLAFGTIKIGNIKLSSAAAKWRDFNEATAKNRIGSTGFNGPDVLNLSPVSVGERRRRF